jgi:hypothetical protein
MAPSPWPDARSLTFSVEMTHIIPTLLPTQNDIVVWFNLIPFFHNYINIVIPPGPFEPSPHHDEVLRPPSGCVCGNGLRLRPLYPIRPLLDPAQRVPLQEDL